MSRPPHPEAGSSERPPPDHHRPYAFDPERSPRAEDAHIGHRAGDPYRRLSATWSWACIFLAVVHASSGDAETARSVRDEALRVADVYVSQSVRAAAYYMAGSVDAVLGDDVAAQHRLRRAMDIARDAGSPYTLARLLPPLARRLVTVIPTGPSPQWMKQSL